MRDSSVALLIEQVKAYLARLAVMREYHQNADNPAFKGALASLIEEAQEAIALLASRLRQLNQPVDTDLDEAGEKLTRQARSRRSTADKLNFIRRGLKYQQDWYNARIKGLKDDADTQALFVALAEQTRVRLERWESLMKDLKVSPEE